MTLPSGTAKGTTTEKLPRALEAVRLARRSKDTSPTPNLEETEALELVTRALKFGDQGVGAVQCFEEGNWIRLIALFGDDATFGFKERVERLKLDVLDLEDGKRVFGSAEEMLSPEDFKAFRRDWLVAQGRAGRKGSPAPGVIRVGAAMSPLRKSDAPPAA